MVFDLLLKDGSIFIRRQLTLKLRALYVNPRHKVIITFFKLLGVLEGLSQPLLFLDGELANVLPSLIEL